MAKLKDIPDLKVTDMLKISFDGLETYQKELFLDIACFWRFCKKDTAMVVLEACGFHPKIGIKVLMQKALITIVDGKFDMHDLIQEMGHYIARGEHRNNPEKHSRLWNYEEIEGLPLSDETMEFDNIEAIVIEDCYYDSSRFCKIVSNMKKLRLLIMFPDSALVQNEGVNFLSNELLYMMWSCYPASPFPHSFQPMKLVVLKLDGSMQKEVWKGYKHLPCLRELELLDMYELLITPDFDGLPCLKKLTLRYCFKLEEIHPSLGSHTNIEYLNVSDCDQLKRFPTFSGTKNIKTLIIEGCNLQDGEIPCGVGELSSLEELNLSRNNFSRLDFSVSQLTQLKCLLLSYCNKLLELPRLPSSLAILTANGCRSLTIVEDFNKDCTDLCDVQLYKYGWTDRLLQSMLKGKAIENGCMHLRLNSLEIPKGFTPPLIRRRCCRLELPENWCNDFSGFLICSGFPVLLHELFSAWISIKQVSGIDLEDDVVSEECHGYIGTIWVWYVSFGSLRHTTWWDQTYKYLEFHMDGYLGATCEGLQVKLVDKGSTSGGLTDTSTSCSSPYTPKFKITHDSLSELKADLVPYPDPY